MVINNLTREKEIKMIDSLIIMYYSRIIADTCHISITEAEQLIKSKLNELKRVE